MTAPTGPATGGEESRGARPGGEPVALRRVRPLAAVALAVAALSASCGFVASIRGDARSDMPEGAVDRVTAALEARDWGALYDASVSPSTRRLFDADLEKVRGRLVASGGVDMFARSVLGVDGPAYLAMDARDFFVRMSEVKGEVGDLLVAIPDRGPMLHARVTDVRVEGDEALVWLELPGGPRPLPMIREDGRWYVQVLDDD